MPKNFFEKRKRFAKKILTSKNGYDKIILLRNLFDVAKKIGKKVDR